MEDDGLTTGVIQRLLNKENVHKPVLQISDLKAIRNDSAERCRIVLFDGADCLTYAMLGAHLTNTASDNHIDKYAVVRLEKYMWYTVRESSRDILVVLGLTVIRKGTDVGRTLRMPSISIFSTPSTAPVAASFESSSSGGIIPIAQLTPSYPGRTIRVRVTATAFNQDCDRLYDAIQVNKVYDISNYIVKPPKDPSYSIFEHEYELLFTSETTVCPCPDDPPNIPKLKLKSVPISNVPNVTEEQGLW
ncbi:hypothetical protein MRX96_044051 [Rhipicephalus microplus]